MCIKMNGLIYLKHTADKSHKERQNIPYAIIIILHMGEKNKY